jgi:hypothetical protein
VSVRVREPAPAASRGSCLLLEHMSRTIHLCFALALCLVCVGCCIFGLFAWASTGAGPWGTGDAIRSVLIIGGLFALAGWGAVRNFRRAFHAPRKDDKPNE